MIKIILNIFKNKTYLRVFLLTTLLFILIILFKNTFFIPLFKKGILDTTLTEATKVSTHLSRTLDLNDANSIDGEIQIILKEFRINKINYFSKDGKLLYSTQKNNVEKYIADDYFTKKVVKGEIYSKINNLKKETLNNNDFISIEIYIPIMKDGIFIGAFEYYYDITNEINTFNRHVNQVSLYVYFFNAMFFFIILTLLYIASKNNLKDIEYKNELENFKNIIDETKAYIYIKDLNGCYLFANKLVLDLFNISLKDLIGKSDSDFFDLEVYNEFKKNDDLIIKSGQAIEDEESILIKESGEKKVFWTVKKPLLDNDGKIIGMSGISTDITDRKMGENEIKEQKKLLDVILDNVDAYIYIKDINRNFRYVNTQTAQLFRKNRDQIIGYKDFDVLPKEMADIFWESDKDVFSKNEKVCTEETIIDPKGEVKHYWSTKLPYILNNERVLIGFSSDITEIYNMKEELKKDAITDSLTTLYNKRHFEIIAEAEFKRSIRQNLNMSIIIFDIDHFKSVNDTYGHKVGDMILEEASKVFKSQIRDEDTLFRIGGEEFTIVSPHINSLSAIKLAERIRIAIKDTIFETDEKERISITLSFGIADKIKSDDKFENILLRADKALYKAKNSGRNKVCML